MSDLFGLNREERIKKSGVRNIFTPHMPIKSVELLFGRQAEVQKLIEHLNTPGQHALLYGDWGVGKSSLANVTVAVLMKNLFGSKSFTKRCDFGDTFETIFAQPLKEVGIDVDVNGSAD